MTSDDKYREQFEAAIRSGNKLHPDIDISFLLQEIDRLRAENERLNIAADEIADIHVCLDAEGVPAGETLGARLLRFLRARQIS